MAGAAAVPRKKSWRCDHWRVASTAFELAAQEILAVRQSARRVDRL
jgi:hypothetical protein